ncbi:MAG: hypothetical protein ACR2NR_15270 [Solirubrobacteraceae bacterium]
MSGATLIAPPEPIAPREPAAPAAAVDRRQYTCPECGHVLHVFGRGRHRVCFEVDDERWTDPIMEGACPQCGHNLPGKGGGEKRS